MQTLVISYFCDVDGRTYYTDHAKRFKEECESFGIPYSIDHLESQGSYQNNCLIKPKFIYKKLIENATEIHCIDSSFKHLVESLKTSGILFYHKNFNFRSTSSEEHKTNKNWIEI